MDIFMLHVPSFSSHVRLPKHTIFTHDASLEKNGKKKHAPDLPEKSCRPCFLCFSLGKLILGATVDPKAISAPCIPTSYSKFQKFGSLNSCWSMIAFNLVLSLIAIHPQTLFLGCLLTQLKGPNSPFNFLQCIYSNQGLITPGQIQNFSSGIQFSMRLVVKSGCTHQSFRTWFYKCNRPHYSTANIPHLQSHLVPSFILHTNFSTPKLQTPWIPSRPQDL